jgi:phage I-like protein
MCAEWNAVATELVACLKRQREQFRIFLELLARQHDALVSRDTESLDRITAEQERAVAHSRQIEDERRDLTSRLARLGEGLTEAGTISDITRLVEASEATELAQIQTQLQSQQKEIERRGRLNAALVE